MSVIYYNKGDIYNKNGMMVHVNNPSTWEIEVVGLRLAWATQQDIISQPANQSINNFFKNENKHYHTSFPPQKGGNKKVKLGLGR